MARKRDSLLDEIYQQPEALRRTLLAEDESAREIAARTRRRRVALAVIAGRGSSDNAALYARYLLESVNRLPVSLAAPSIFTLYHSPPRLSQALVIGVSQSGESLDVLEVLREGLRQGALTVAVTNEADSPLVAEAACALIARAGPERSVPATKSYTCQLALFALLSSALSRERAARDALDHLPEYVAAVLALEPAIQAATVRYRYMSRCVVLGRGYNMSTALEVALKIKETSYVLAQPYSMADFLHGPIALIEPGFPVLLIAPSGPTLANLKDVAGKLRQRRAELVVFSDDADLLSQADTPIALPSGVPELLSPLPYTVAGQLFAYHLARTRGLDPASPRGLLKVTLTL